MIITDFVRIFSYLCKSKMWQCCHICQNCLATGCTKECWTCRDKQWWSQHFPDWGCQRQSLACQPFFLNFAENCMKEIVPRWIRHLYDTYQTRTRRGRARCRRSVWLCWCWTRVGCKTSPSSPAAAQRSPPDGTRLSVREHSSGINHWWPLETGNEKTLWWSYLQDIVSDKNFFSRSEDTICNRKKSSLVQVSEIDLWQYQMK